MGNTDTKRIAKNTVVLYIKLIISIIINFVVARLVLQALGASDYGLYNVVGGIVAMLNVLGTAMVATSYRYMAVEIGKGENGSPNNVYNTVLVVHLLLALFLLLVGETGGVFYIENYLNIETDKLDDAKFVLHFSLLSTIFTVISIPSNGLIVARERFLFTSVINIFSDILKLVVILVVLFCDCNKLRLYTVLLAIVYLITPISFQIYSRIKDPEIVKWKFNKCINDYKEVLIFAWWIFIGAFASIAKTQGAAMIINVFFGTILNAAFGLATQVYSAATQFTTTIRQATVPQIMKGQVSGDEIQSMNLVYMVSRFSYLLMLIPSIPIMICVRGVLNLWLGNPPKYTDVFIVLMLLNGMIANLCAGFDATIQATGKIKKNQIGYCIISLSLLPIIFYLYKLGLPPYVNIVTMCFLTTVTLIFQCCIMKQISCFDLKIYLKTTVRPSLLATIVSVVPLSLFIKLFNYSVSNTVCGAIISTVWACITVFIIGLNKNEKNKLLDFIKAKLTSK